MIELTEVEQRVLAELEEVWEQNIFTMLNTIIEPKGDPTEVEALQEALNGLVERGFVAVGLEEFSPRKQTTLDKQAALELVSRLRDWFRFDAATSFWTLSKGDFREVRYPVIFSTAEAREKAFQILDERGYQWWRQQE
ncbi:MAG: hypothetical protein K2X43_24740 [Hyphomonadaceae bacterium]|jgi:hypothetical protein|nr:hypothetical protein [Hyphomonadaceae bacterium]